ncbi:hypothetical protein GCM10022419_024430 [Nonomuraea rosea]|uniref:FtsX extracellular domain-containing protein n=1 Tax=Nonomuraea rosea TaxID=638574 RepID=A0ABP6VY85_9ACTN
MNSPVEERLREALAEAGASIDTSTLRPLQARRRRPRVDLRLVAVAAVVAIAGATTAVVLGGPGDEDRAVATNVEPVRDDQAEVIVFLCTKSEPPCQERATPEQVKTVEQTVKRLPGVEEVFFDSQATAYDDFRKTYASNKALLDAVRVTDMSPSFRLKLSQGADRNEISRRLQGVLGIQTVSDLSQPTTADLPEVEPKVSVFLCAPSSAMPACGAKRTDDAASGVNEVAKGGKGVTGAQKEDLARLIESMPEVESFVFEDQATAYANFKRSFAASNKALVEATKVEDMPESFRLTMKPDARWEKAVSKLRRQPGVGQVSYLSTSCITKQSRLRGQYLIQQPEEKVCSSAG